MFGISLTFTIVGLVTFDLSVNEIKKLLGSRNEGFAFNMIQGLDKHIENRIFDFQQLSNLNLVHMALINSNEKFEKIQDIRAYLSIKENEIEFIDTDPFIENVADDVLTEELLQTIKFYHDEYDYDVVEELFVTNAYGANVALGSGTSDYSQSDEEWWEIAKNSGKYMGKIHFDENYDSYSIDFAFRINDINEDFIGVLRVVLTLDDIISNFVEEADIITIPGRSVLLLDDKGNPIYSHDKIFVS